jgi:hypothetical protein
LITAAVLVRRGEVKGIRGQSGDLVVIFRWKKSFRSAQAVWLEAGSALSEVKHESAQEGVYLAESSIQIDFLRGQRES